MNNRRGIAMAAKNPSLAVKHARFYRKKKTKYRELKINGIISKQGVPN